MNKNIIKTVIILLALTFVTLQSCEKKAMIDVENEIVINNNKVYADKGILVFQNQKDYFLTINELANKTDEERKSWGKVLDLHQCTLFTMKLIRQKLLWKKNYLLGMTKI